MNRQRVNSLIVREARTSGGLRTISDARINATVQSGTALKPSLLPKLEHFINVRVDNATRDRLDTLLMARAKDGWRLSLGDLGRVALLRYLDEEEEKLQPTAVNS